MFGGALPCQKDAAFPQDDYDQNNMDEKVGLQVILICLTLTNLVKKILQTLSLHLFPIDLIP